MNNRFFLIDKLRDEGELGLFEAQFAHFIARFENSSSKVLIHIAALVSNDQLKGNICTDLTKLDQSNVARRLNLHAEDLHSLKAKLLEFDCVGKPGDYKPFIIEGDKLYLHKYWVYENELISWFRSKAKKGESSVLNSEQEGLPNIYTSGSEEMVDLQQVAVCLALLQDLVIISGGPGTGKTYTVKMILDELLKVDRNLTIALAAPTGKAAERLNESVSENYESIPASTLHKLLGARRNGEFKFNADNKLPHDVVIVDEASMLDIRLWISLIRALKSSSKVILLGDKNQLSSVEAGSILGDVCFDADNGFSIQMSDQITNHNGSISESSSSNILNDHIVLLEKSYRTRAGSGISEFAKAINEENVSLAFKHLDEFSEIDIKAPANDLISSLIEDYSNEIISNNSFTQFLCSNKKGVFGTEQLNNRIEIELKKKLAIPSYIEWYEGRRIIITKNDHSTGLSNGEIGTCFLNEDEKFYVDFGKSGKVLTSQLISYNPAFAITVHKSQGSEFNRVVLFLPDRLNPVLTKELLYTGVTRAKENTLVIVRRKLLEQIIGNPISRISSIPVKLTN